MDIPDFGGLTDAEDFAPSIKPFGCQNHRACRTRQRLKPRQCGAKRGDSVGACTRPDIDGKQQPGWCRALGTAKGAGGVGHGVAILGKPADSVERMGEWHRAFQGQEPEGRSDPPDAAERCGQPDRSSGHPTWIGRVARAYRNARLRPSGYRPAHPYGSWPQYRNHLAGLKADIDAFKYGSRTVSCRQSARAQHLFPAAPSPAMFLSSATVPLSGT